MDEEDRFDLEYQPRYRSYRSLMKQRINEILLVSSIYDSFIIEEDVRLSDQIFEEFHNLNLRTLPHISRASSASQAMELLQEKKFDLIITMRRLGEENPWHFARKVKSVRDIPIVLLLNHPDETHYLKASDLQEGMIDRVFIWNGNSTVFVAIIKLLEDEMNVRNDTVEEDVRVIIVVEDSIRFSSLYLPALYTEIMHQTHRLIHEGGNDYHSLLRLRTRPKILLAKNYQEARDYYREYKDYLLGIITDVKFPRAGRMDPQAGFELISEIRKEYPTLPVMFQSSDEANRARAEEMKGYFANKNNRSLGNELRNFLMSYMGFGPFTFRFEDDRIFGAAENLFEMREMVERVPQESLNYHARNDHFSGWLAARGEFEMARLLKPRRVSEFKDGEGFRQYLVSFLDKIVEERLNLIIDFDRANYNPHSRFVRLRPGSMGGKGRGIAFLLFLRSSFWPGLQKEFPGVKIQIPKTYVIGTEEFENFMQHNNLHNFALSDVTDREIKERFLNAELSQSLCEDLKLILSHLKTPLAVRSSNISEDSIFQPFAGVFSTYMVPNCHPDLDFRLEQLIRVIKLVYASTYFRVARSYAETLRLPLAESRMALVIQEVVGEKHHQHFYPHFSGTAASYNYYPLGERLKPQDRIAFLALGLGKAVVDGGLAKRFSPRHPEINTYGDTTQMVKNSQREFYAVNLNCRAPIDLDKGEEAFLTRLDLRSAIEDGTLENIADTVNPQDGTLTSGYWQEGQGAPVITFNRQLKYETQPLARVINRMLILGEKAMGCPVEIEFAGNISSQDGQPTTFYLLQLRPFIEHEETLSYEMNFQREDHFIFSRQISGNRVREDIRDVVAIKPAEFDHSMTREMVVEIDHLNRELVSQGRPYILIGPGRWGTYDRHLGIPVDWSSISGARVIVEIDLEDFRVDHSQGSHFFHNISTAGIPYIFVPYGVEKHFLDWKWLAEQEVAADLQFFRHYRTPAPFLVAVNGKEQMGQIVKPDSAGAENRFSSIT